MFNSTYSSNFSFQANISSLRITSQSSVELLSGKEDDSSKGTLKQSESPTALNVMGNVQMQPSVGGKIQIVGEIAAQKVTSVNLVVEKIVTQVSYIV